MTHLTEEDMTAAYYGDLETALRAHLDDCPQCQAQFSVLKRLLDDLRDAPVPERGPGYGGAVWTRLLPHLLAERPHRSWLRWWTVAPALAAVAIAAFIAGMMTQQRRQPVAVSAKARERVLLVAMGDHLDRSQIVLAELVNATPETLDLNSERVRARSLIGENRLIRQTALRSGDSVDAAVLDELERTLLDIANGPANISPPELEALQRRIESEGLLLKVRIVSTNVRQKGQQL